MLKEGSLIDGRYTIIKPLGSGASGVACLAVNKKTNKQWVLKELKDFRDLEAETEVFKTLNHRCLPALSDIVIHEGKAILVMDYVEGVSLSAVLKEKGKLKQDEVITYAKQLCEVFCYLHGQNPPVIYRDLKPSNIMIRPDNSLVLIDFGAAGASDESVQRPISLGTIGYAAPEQFTGRGRIDERTDIYCFGAMLYHLLTGIGSQDCTFEPKPLREIDRAFYPGLEYIIKKCTRIKQKDRYQSMEEVAYDLNHMGQFKNLRKNKFFRNKKRKSILEV